MVQITFMQDNQLIDEIIDAKRKLDTVWKTTTLQKINQHVNEYPLEWRKKKRLQFLTSCADDLLYSKELYGIRHEIYLERGRITEAFLTQEEIRSLSNQLDNIEAERKRVASEQDNQWEERKRAAKEVPFESLYQFSRGSALCPFHADTNPSLSLMPGNRVWCHSCHRGWDTISFTMEYNNVGFNEAVNQLCNLGGVHEK